MDRRIAIKTATVGALMGAAEVVPGVSGGTIAFISGIYERLVNALSQLTPALVPLLIRHGIGFVWTRTDATFLLLLGAGMAVSIIMFANTISYLLGHHPVGLWSFFAGLVVASVYVVTRQISRFGLDLLLAALAGACVGGFVTLLVPIELAPTLPAIFLGGAIAVCAWILPGLSGSFILLILGLYAFVIDAIRSFDLMVLVVLALGCAVGLICFSQVLSRLMRHLRDQTLAVLTGFMAGSLVKLWPWKHTLSYQLTADGASIPLIEEPVLPATYTALTGNEPMLGIAGLCMTAGLVLVLVIHWLTSGRS